MTNLHPFDHVWPLFAPLSRATTPLRQGLLRRQLLAAGVQMRDVMLEGVRLNCYVRELPNPTTPPLLFIHGLGDSAMTWGGLYSLLPERNIYAIDLPGYGFSSLPRGKSHATIDEMRDMLEMLIHETIRQPPVIIGNSMGGWLAIALALHAPELARGLVLLNPGGALLGGATAYSEFRELLSAADLGSARLVLRRMFGAVPKPLLYVSQSALQAVFQRPVVADFMTGLTEEAFLSAEQLCQVQVPSALVWGQADAFLPDGSFAFFRDHLAHTTLHVLPDVGHLAHVERPVEVAVVIEQVARWG